ncbi:MAG: FlgK family flagellar hook-associated protein, partial [Pseudobdellovibrionaceae bacterium]
MSKISAMMDVGKRSLSNSQSALQTVAHNIANKSTEGYSRQRVELMTNQPITSGNLQIGMGARAGVMTRTNNPWLEKQIQRENTSLGFMDTQAEALGRVEQVYNEQVNKGLNQYMTDFFNGFRELANNPESLSSRTVVRESAVSLSNDFKR